MSKVTAEYAGRKVSAKYSTKQIGQTHDYVSTLVKRHDVAQVISSLQGIVKPRIERKEITARDGNTHEYLLVGKGRKRFLFDMPDDPTVQQEPSEMTWVVPATVMERRKLLPSQPHHFKQFRNFFDVQYFLGTIEREGYFAGRDTGANVEHNTDFIQPVPALIVTDTHRQRRSLQTRMQLPIRNSDPSVNFDTRLAGMIVAPFAMGHSDPEDFGHPRRLLKHTLYRETAEETAYTHNTHDPKKTFHVFKEKDGQPTITFQGIWKLRHYYHFTPLGIVYLQEKEIDQVHAGFVMLAEPKTNSVTFTLNEKSHESLPPVWMSPQEYKKAIDQGDYAPASWNKPIIEEGLIPYLSSRKRHGSTH